MEFNLWKIWGELLWHLRIGWRCVASSGRYPYVDETWEHKRTGDLRRVTYRLSDFE